MRTVRDILAALPTTAEAGLGPAAVEPSRQRFGSNRLTTLPREPLWRKFLAKFDEPIIKILLAAALLSMFVELFPDNPIAAGVALGVVAVAVVGLFVARRSAWVPALTFVSALAVFALGLVVPPHHASVEGLAVMVAVVLATGVAFLSEYRSDREFEALNARKESLRAKVVRGGAFHTVPMEEVVVGDAVSLEMGDEVPADGRLLKSADFYVDQSLMTGEPEPVHKKVLADSAAEGFEQPDCLYRGTQVVDGVGLMLVTEVGDATHLGQIARHLSAEEASGGRESPDIDNEERRVQRKLTISKELTPLQLKLQHLAGLISKVGYAAAALIFVALLVRGVLTGELRWPGAGKNLVSVGDIDDVAISSDGKRIAFGRSVPQGLGETGEIAIHAADGTRLASFQAHSDHILAIALNPDGTRVASLGADGTLRVHDALTGNALVTIPSVTWKDDPFTGLAFLQDGRRLVVKQFDAVSVWDTDTSRQISPLAGKEGRAIFAAAFDPDAWRVAETGDEGLMLYHRHTGRPVPVIGEDWGPLSVAFSPNGRYLAAGNFHGEVKLLEAETGKELLSFAGHDGEVTRLAFSPDGKRLASASAGTHLEVKTWDTETGRLLHTQTRRVGIRITSGMPPFKENFGAPYALAFHDGGLLVATGKGQRTAEVWEATQDDFWTILFADLGHLLSYFMYVVIVIVVAVPEGLPMSVTVSLALAMRRMTRENSLVRQLVACETIGSATVICSDKTGTLTQNKMRVVWLGWDGQALDTSRRLPTPFVRIGGAQHMRPVDWIALIAAVNSTANLEEKDGKLGVVGNSTEGALLWWVRESGVDYAALRRHHPLLFTIHFSSDRKRMTSVVGHGEGMISLVKGAPEWLLEHTTDYLTADGEFLPWTPEARAAARAVVRDASARAMRTLAFGYVGLPLDMASDEDTLHARQTDLENGLVYVGVAAIRDPLRDDVKAAVAECRAAGIEVKMITGDNVETARAIAFDVGLIDARDAAIDTPDAAVMTSPALEALSDDELKARLPKLRVVARARPLDKYRLVKALQEMNQVVAVTGDGTNDAPALKRADVGLAMGIAGTEVAKEASKIVLLDDAFSTIVKAVHWGRSLYENIQRFLQFQLTINVSALTIAFLGPFFGVKPPFTVLQLLWINVIMDTFASVALCSEPPREGVMRQPPKRRDESILTRPMLVTIFTTAAFFVVVMMALLAGMEWYGWFREGSEPSADFPELTVRQVSIFFSVYVFFQVWNQVNCRSLTADASGLSGLGRNPTFLMIAGTVALVQVLIVSVPFLGAVFQVAPLGWLDWLGVVAGTASVLAFAEVVRRLRRAGPRQRSE